MKGSMWFILLLLITFTTATENEEEVAIEDIKKLEEEMKNAVKYVEGSVNDEQITIVFGLTKSGKSTLINYLLENELIGENKIDGIVLRKKDINSSGPEIGNSISSETKIPKKWKSDHLENVSFWDAPGFEDNRGPIQDIINAFYIYQLFQNADSLKIILVVDFQDILNHNVRQFSTLLTAVEKLLSTREMKNCFNSIALIFTKVPFTFHKKHLDITLVAKILEAKFSSSTDNNGFSSMSHKFIKHLLENQQNIGLFREAEVGLVKASSIDVNILQAIKNLEPASKDVLSHVLPSLSDKSLLFLRKAREEMYSPKTFEKLSDSIEKYILNAASRVHENIESIIILHEIEHKLTFSKNRIREALKDSTTCGKRIKALKQIDVEINFVIENENLLEKYNLIKFTEKLIDSKDKEQIDGQLKLVMRSAISSIDKLIDFVNRKINNIRREEEENRKGTMAKILGGVGAVLDTFGETVISAPFKLLGKLIYK